MLNPETLRLAKTLWDYHHMNMVLQKADCILALGSQDTRVAERAAELYLEGWAPILIFSGGVGRITKALLNEPEAELFARIALQKGVPKENILLETQSTNTGENISFTRNLLKERGLDPQRIILVQKPYMERRAYATFQKQWPGKTVYLTSPQISFEDYPTAAIPIEQVIDIMVGDLQRIRLYAEKGFQVPQKIPSEVWKAYEQLVDMGFDKQLAKEA